MCGLYGSITSKKLTEDQYKVRNRILDSLAIVNESRGDQSTGIASITGTEYEIFKNTKKASDFIELKKYKNLMGKNADIIIGHTRLATTGHISKKNAHPFVKGNIIGSHNGIITNHAELDKTAMVDSEAIFTVLNRKNNNFKKALPKIEGSFALSWYNLNEPGMVYLALHDNPIAIVNIPELNTIFWSSEYLGLLSIINASGVKLDGITDLMDNTVYAISKDLNIIDTKIKMPSKNYTTYYNRHEMYPEAYNDDYEGSKWTKKEATPDYIPDSYLIECSVCQYEFPANEIVHYDYMSEEIFCSKCVGISKSTTIDAMSFNEYRNYSYQD